MGSPVQQRGLERGMVVRLGVVLALLPVTLGALYWHKTSLEQGSARPSAERGAPAVARERTADLGEASERGGTTPATTERAPGAIEDGRGEDTRAAAGGARGGNEGARGARDRAQDAPPPREVQPPDPLIARLGGEPAGELRRGDAIGPAPPGSVLEHLDRSASVEGRRDRGAIPAGASPAELARGAEVGRAATRALSGSPDGRRGGSGTRGSGRSGLARETIPLAEVSGSEGDEITSIVRNYEPGLAACYEAALKREPSLRGRATLRFQITPAGRVANVELQSGTKKLSDVAECVSRRAREWRFPKPEGGPVQVVYPVFFVAG